MTDSVVCQLSDAMAQNDAIVCQLRMMQWCTSSE